MERRKYLRRANAYFEDAACELVRLDEPGLAGYAALWTITRVSRPLLIGELCLYDDGFRELMYLPDGERWSLSAIYDARGDIVEWYVDITKKNGVDPADGPYADDLYLDAAVMPDGRVVILDEDELQAARDQGSITPQEFLMAQDTLKGLKVRGILTAHYMKELCARLRGHFGTR